MIVRVAYLRRSVYGLPRLCMAAARMPLGIREIREIVRHLIPSGITSIIGRSIASWWETARPRLTTEGNTTWTIEFFMMAT